MAADIDAAATDNAVGWARRADDVVSGSPGAAEFREACRATRVGTNVHASKLETFMSLDPPRMVSTYAVVAAARSAAAAERIVYETGDWSARRSVVEDALDARRTAVYGTPDLPDHLGNPDYGPFHLVYDPASPGRPALVLPHNSAAAYGPVPVRLVDDVARWSDRADLLTAERGERAALVAASVWPALIGDVDPTSRIEEDLIEVVLRDGERCLDEVAEIRVSAADFQDDVDLLALEGLAAPPEAQTTIELAALVAQSARALAAAGVFAWREV